MFKQIERLRVALLYKSTMKVACKEVTYSQPLKAVWFDL